MPDELVAVVERMMAKDPAKRYQTPAEVMAALARWVATPIPPPSDREMPHVSPAAGGGRRGGTTYPWSRRASSRRGSERCSNRRRIAGPPIAW